MKTTFYFWDPKSIPLHEITGCTNITIRKTNNEIFFLLGNDCMRAICNKKHQVTAVKRYKDYGIWAMLHELMTKCNLLVLCDADWDHDNYYFPKTVPEGYLEKFRDFVRYVAEYKDEKEKQTQ